MKTKALGFTLIELLVVIVIIGILATVSTATFGQYFGKARDAARKTNISTIAMMYRVDGSTNWNDNKYVYDADSLQALFDENDYRAPKGDNNICYFIGMGVGSEPVGDDNQFVVATWGESTSTEDANNPGMIYDGTALAMETLFDLTPVAGDFACGAGAIANTDNSIGGGRFWLTATDGLAAHIGSTATTGGAMDDAETAAADDTISPTGGWLYISKDGTVTNGTEPDDARAPVEGV